MNQLPTTHTYHSGVMLITLVGAISFRRESTGEERAELFSRRKSNGGMYRRGAGGYVTLIDPI